MHAAETTKFYQVITHVLLTSAKESVIGTGNQRKQSTSLYIPDWKCQVKQAHSLARNAHLTWRTSGKPLHDSTYEQGLEFGTVRNYGTVEFWKKVRYGITHGIFW